MARLSYTTGNYGWFASNFTQESCSRFYMVSPVLKGIYSFVPKPSQARTMCIVFLASCSDDDIASNPGSQVSYLHLDFRS